MAQEFREPLLVTLTLPFSALPCVAAAAILHKTHFQSESRLKAGEIIRELKRWKKKCLVQLSQQEDVRRQQLSNVFVFLFFLAMSAILTSQRLSVKSLAFYRT